MATVFATVVGDLSNQTAVDFAHALVRARANTPAIIDPDNNVIRLFDPDDFKAVAPDGAWSLPNLIAAADTAVPGTLQWYIDVKVVGGGIITFGPYVLTVGTQDITDLQVVPKVEFNSTIDVSDSVLSDAEDFALDLLDTHVAAPNPHTQYGIFVDGSGNPIPSARIIVQAVGSALNPASYPDKTLIIRTS